MTKILKKIQLNTEQSVSRITNPAKGTQSSPYTQEEMSQLQAQEVWHGGYVEAMGYMASEMVSSSEMSSESDLICIMCLITDLIENSGFSEFERKCLIHFLTGNGNDLQLTDEEWKMVKNAIPQNVNRQGKQTVSFYGNRDLDWALGRATITFNKKGEPIALSDPYNFDPKAWGDRGLAAEAATRLMHYVELFGGGKPYNIIYKVH